MLWLPSHGWCNTTSRQSLTSINSFFRCTIVLQGPNRVNVAELERLEKQQAQQAGYNTELTAYAHELGEEIGEIKQKAWNLHEENAKQYALVAQLQESRATETDERWREILASMERRTANLRSVVQELEKKHQEKMLLILEQSNI